MLIIEHLLSFPREKIIHEILPKSKPAGKPTNLPLPNDPGQTQTYRIVILKRFFPPLF